MKTIFLDLEETIIESVDNPRILFNQIEKIKKFISKKDEIALFSFALWEEKDLTNILSNIVEEQFGKFSVVFKNDLMPLFKKKFGIQDQLDFIDFSRDKETVFILFILDQIKNGMQKNDCLFFDDMVSELTLNCSEVKVEIKNVKKLADKK